MEAKFRKRTVAGTIAGAALMATTVFVSHAVHAAPADQKGSPSQRRDLGDVVEAKRIIRASLNDPSSALFEVAQPRSGLAEDGMKTSLVCGTYNAKNRLGGYVGRVLFAYSKSARAVFTSKVARLEADGNFVSLSALGDSLRGTPSMDQIGAVQAQGSELQKQVQFWLGQCEG